MNTCKAFTGYAQRYSPKVLMLAISNWLSARLWTLALVSALHVTIIHSRLLHLQSPSASSLPCLLFSPPPYCTFFKNISNSPPSLGHLPWFLFCYHAPCLILKRQTWDSLTLISFEVPDGLVPFTTQCRWVGIALAMGGLGALGEQDGSGPGSCWYPKLNIMGKLDICYEKFL